MNKQNAAYTQPQPVTSHLPQSPVNKLPMEIFITLNCSIQIIPINQRLITHWQKPSGVGNGQDIGRLTPNWFPLFSAQACCWIDSWDKL